MFTGIVESIGKVVSLKEFRRNGALRCKQGVCADDVKLGDSIAVSVVALLLCS